MTEFSEKRKKLNLIVLIPVTWAVLVRCSLYLYVAFRGIGTIDIKSYVPILINFSMYVSVLLYTVKYFFKQKDVSLNTVIFRYGASVLSTLVGMKSQNDIIFILTALMVFLVPYTSANLKKKKLNVILIVSVYIISVCLSLMYILNPVDNYYATYGSFIYHLDAINPTIQWTLFAYLFFMRGYLEKTGIQ